MKATALDTLPPLAWLCDFSVSGGVALHHGLGVSISGSRFFEGAWDGTYEEFGFDTCTNVFGSGGVVDGQRGFFVSPSHTLEALYVLTTKDGTAVSNSLSFALSALDDDLIVDNWHYGALFASVVRGLNHTPIRMPSKKGTLTLVHHHNFAISRDDIQIVPKPLPPPFPDYASYVGYVRRTLSAVARNASASGRRLRYQLVTSVSSGYDSSACAALASGLGCRRAVTLRTSGTGDSDSGRAIAGALGLNVKEFDRVARITGPPDSEAEFLASGMQGEDIVYRAFGEELTGALFLTGFHGDKVWEKGIAPTAYIKRGDISGSSLGEFRLARDFVHTPVPFIGAQRHPDIWRISNSPEMRPFSVGGAYDRPIPRRLAEEAGVTRSCFGVVKKAASLHLFWTPRLMSESTLRDIKQFATADRMSIQARIRFLALAARWWVGMSLVRAKQILGLRERLGHNKDPGEQRLAGHAAFARLFGDEFSVFEHAHPRNTVWLRWARARMRYRYRCNPH